MLEATEEWRLAALPATTKVAEAEMVDLAEFDGTVAAAHSMVRRMRRAGA